MNRKPAVQALCAGVSLATLALLPSVVSAANGSADFTMNGTQVTASSMNITLGTSYALQYNGGLESCTDVEWYIKKPSLADHNFDHDQSASIKEFRKGTYTLTMKATGYDSRFLWWGCNNTNPTVERTLTLNLSEEGEYQTRYPIMLVPGVLAYDTVYLLGIAYFYGIANEIRSKSDQPVIDVSLDPWQRTEERGIDLANKIVDFLIEHDVQFEDPNSPMKVNLIAHSHGSTTSRLALRALREQFGTTGKVASLTTIGGPHYGTPTADGTQWVVENWDPESDGAKFIKGVTTLLGDIGTEALNIFTGEFLEFNDYEASGIDEVIAGFTQRGMARFNSCYPSMGLPTGGKYFIENNLSGKPILDSQRNYSLTKNSTGTSATINVSDCLRWNATANAYTSDRSVSKAISLTSTPNSAYGANTSYKTYSASAAGVYGDGRGNSRSATASDAIRYFSFTGSSEWNTNGWDFIVDSFMALFQSAHQLVGARTTEAAYDSWFSDLMATLGSGDPVDRNVYGNGTGYQSNSDAFIPVYSARFGQYVTAYQNWNHMDEVNGMLGLVHTPSTTTHPYDAYGEHVARLKLHGL
jgi:triacylglycerol esterase/lipase EstA (alpha/beta hydrolase family)